MRSTLTSIVLGLAILAQSSCATSKPRWTPETVALPVPAAPEISESSPIGERANPINVTPQGGGNPQIPLSRDGAILTAVRNNRSLEVARYSPDIAETFVPEARAAFDPLLLGTISTGRSTLQFPAGSGINGSQSSSTASGTTGVVSTSGSGGSGTTTPMTPADFAQQNLDTAQRALRDLQSVLLLIDRVKHPYTVTTNTDGSLTLQEFVPTGTQLFLTGAVTRTDTNRTFDDYIGSWTLSVNQSLLRGAGLAVNLIDLRQAKNRAAESEHAFRAQVIAVVQQVEVAYWELVLDDEVLKIRQFAVELADDQLKRNEDMFSVGKIVEGDVMAAKAEKSSRLADLADAQAAIRTVTLTLLRLLNPNQGPAWQAQFNPEDNPDIVQVAVNPDTSEKLAIQYRPELAQLRLELANADLEIRRARNGMLPKLDLTASYGRTSRGENLSSAQRYLDSSDYDDYSIGVNLETPILYRAERARRDRAKMLQSQADASIDEREQGVATEVRQAVVEVQRQWDRIGATQDAVKSRKEELRIAQDRNAVGKATNLDVQIVQRDLIQAEVDEVTARVRYIEALTALYAAEGTLLERRGIQLADAMSAK